MRIKLSTPWSRAALFASLIGCLAVPHAYAIEEPVYAVV